jgi:hypothetical protein
MQRTLLALVAALAFGGGCGQSSAPKIAVKVIEGDGAIDASDASDGPAVPNSMGRCCALAVATVHASADAGDASVPLPTDNCSVLARNTLGVVEPCLSGDSGEGFGSWTCGTESPQLLCGNNGLSCNLGDPCTLLDVGCPGVVQACTFTPYTRPPALRDSGAG